MGTVAVLTGASLLGRPLQVIAVLLTLMALTWTPISQEWYNHCRDRSNRPHSSVCRGGDALRRIEGLLILAFLAEMTAKVINERV